MMLLMYLFSTRPDNMEGIIMASVVDDPSGIDKLIDYQTPQPYQWNYV